MSPFMELVLPSALIPGILSAFWFILVRLRGDALMPWLMPLIWLPTCFWLVGWPSGIPQEAIGWLWLLLSISVAIPILLLPRKLLALYLQIGLMGLALIVLSWPILTHSPDLRTVGELFAVMLAGIAMLFGSTSEHSDSPALSMAVSSAGLALLTLLGGSVRVGELAGGLAFTLAAFALFELSTRLNRKSIRPFALVALAQIYLALLLIARQYAGIPLVSMLFLLLAPLSGFLLRGIRGPLGSLVSVVLAMIWLLSTSDSSSYY